MKFDKLTRMGDDIYPEYNGGRVAIVMGIPNAEAYAQLFSAAPEMLEALEEVQGVLIALNLQGNRVGTMVKDAIEKATLLRGLHVDK